jgi:hypothetical protein
LAVIKAARWGRLFVFLRLNRHELFDERFQGELAEAYVDGPKGQPPVPPARLALATVLQAYTGVSDDEVIEATIMDRRWQLVLDCMGAEEPPFSKGTLVSFRARLIARDLDRRLIERTVELAARTGGFGARALRAALDLSPLWGAGRVEDTFNLMGHALRKALGVIAAVQGWGQAAGIAAVAAQAGVPQLAASSLKAALDLDWDDPAARDAALAQVLGFLDQVGAFAAGRCGDGDPKAAAAAVQVARQVRDQDVDRLTLLGRVSASPRLNRSRTVRGWRSRRVRLPAGAWLGRCLRVGCCRVRGGYAARFHLELVTVGGVDGHREPDRLAVFAVTGALELEDGDQRLVRQAEEAPLMPAGRPRGDHVAPSRLPDAKRGFEVLERPFSGPGAEVLGYEQGGRAALGRELHRVEDGLQGPRGPSDRPLLVAADDRCSFVDGQPGGD